MVLRGFALNVLRGCAPKVPGGFAPKVLGGFACRVRVIVVVLVRVIVAVLVDGESGRRHPGPQDARRLDVRVAERERAERALQVVERQAGVEQRAERHVARDPGKAVEVEHAAHRTVRSLKLKYRESPRIR